MPAPLKPAVNRNLALQALAGKAARYLDASEKIKPLDAEKKKLSGELKEAAETFGQKDEKGTFELELPGGFVVKKITPKTTTIDHEAAIHILKKLGLLARCTRQIVDEKAIEVAFQEGHIDIDTINSFTKDAEGTPRVSVERA